MPRLYLSLAELQTSPLFYTMSARLSALPSGALDQLLFQASRRCDAFTHRRLGAPATTTVGTGGILVGGTSLPLTSTLGLDNDGEQAVLIGSGATQELVPLLAGGLSVTTPVASPYPGSVTLAQGCAFAHSAGEPVVGY